MVLAVHSTCTTIARVGSTHTRISRLPRYLVVLKPVMVPEWRDKMPGADDKAKKPDRTADMGQPHLLSPTSREPNRLPLGSLCLVGPRLCSKVTEYRALLPLYCCPIHPAQVVKKMRRVRLGKQLHHARHRSLHHPAVNEQNIHAYKPLGYAPGWEERTSPSIVVTRWQPSWRNASYSSLRCSA